MDGRRVELAARQVIYDSLDTLTLSTTCVRRNINSAPTPAGWGYGSTVRGGAWSVLAPGQGPVHSPPGQMLNRRPCESGVCAWQRRREAV